MLGEVACPQFAHELVLLHFVLRKPLPLLPILNLHDDLVSLLWLRLVRSPTPIGTIWHLDGAKKRLIDELQVEIVVNFFESLVHLGQSQSVGV